MASRQNIIIDLQGRATGIRKAAKDGATALAQYNQRLQEIIVGTSRWDASTNMLRNGNVALNDVISRGRQVAAQLNAEKQRSIKIEEMLAANLKKSEVALLRQAGLMSGVGGAAGSASFAVLSLTQGIQDAGQFGIGAAQGIRAVNNNIQQFVTAATFAIGQAGGLGKGLKQMGAALVGPAGILLAFSAVSAGIEYYTNRLQQAKKETNDAAKAWDDAAGNLLKFEDTLSGFAVNIPEGAITPVRIQLEEDIKAIDRALETLKKEEQRGGVRDLFQANLESQAKQLDLTEDITGLQAQQAEREREIADAKALTEGLDMDRLEGQRRLLALLKEQEGFIEKRNELLEIARQLGFDIEDTTKRQLTALQKLTKEWDELVAAFSGSGEAERAQGMMAARIELLKGMRDATVSYSQSIEEMRLLMNQEGVELATHTAALRENNRELRERILLRQQVLGLEKITAAQLRTLAPEEIKLLEDRKAAMDASRESERKAMEQRIEMFNRMGADMVASLAAAGGGMDEFNRMFASFLSKWGKSLVQMGLGAVGFGKAIEAIRQSVHVPGGGFVAIAAGAALVAIGRKLRASTRSAANMGRGGGSGGRTSAPTNFQTGVGFAYQQQGGATTSLLPGRNFGSTPTGINFPGLLSGGYGSSPAMRVQLVAAGRDLVGVVDSELYATGRTSINNPFISVGEGTVSGGGRGDFGGLI